MNFAYVMRTTGLAIGLLALCCCGGNPVAPVQERRQPPPDRLLTHTVTNGDTLYSVAWIYGKDWRQLAALNRLAPPYTIRVGQRLRLDGKVPPASVPAATSRRATTTTPPAARQESRAVQATSRPSQVANGKWQWPAGGAVIRGFTAGGQPHKGIDIAGAAGTPVLAANNGTVVYAGSGIRGYGNLLIVKHSNDYLSAYAHNRRLLVAEGTQVRGGQRIAEIGDSDADSVKLHFEIRRSGKPIDPRSVLPAR